MRFTVSLLPSRKTWCVGISVAYSFINMRGENYAGFHFLSATILWITLQWQWNERIKFDPYKEEG